MFHQIPHPPDFTHEVFPEPSSAVSTQCGPTFTTSFSSTSHTALFFVKGTCQLHFGCLPFQLRAVKTYCFHMLGKPKVISPCTPAAAFPTSVVLKTRADVMLVSQALEAETHGPC